MGYQCKTVTREAYEAGPYRFGKQGELVPEEVDMEAAQAVAVAEAEAKEAEEAAAAAGGGGAGGAPPPVLAAPPPPMGGAGGPPPPPPPMNAALRRASTGKKPVDPAAAARKRAEDEAKMALRLGTADLSSKEMSEEEIAAMKAKEAAKPKEEMAICPRCKRETRKADLDSGTHMASHTAMVTPYLYLGGERNAHNHKELSYRTSCGFILNMSWQSPNYFPEEFEYVCVCVCIRLCMCACR